jgi:isoamylase
MLLDGRAQESGIKCRGSDATLLLVYSAHFDVVNFNADRYESTLRAARVVCVWAAAGRSLAAFGLFRFVREWIHP